MVYGSAAESLGKSPRFVVARSAPVHKQLVCSHVAAESLR